MVMGVVHGALGGLRERLKSGLQRGKRAGGAALVGVREARQPAVRLG